jgi:C1A family cysteine protease
MGWCPDLPDPRDYTPWHDGILKLLRRLKRDGRRSLPKRVDIRRDAEGEYFTPPEDQGLLNCSCACAVLSLVEYFERRGRGRTFEGSTLFLYKLARSRAHKRNRVTGDTGSDLRTTLKVIVQFGVPPAEYWPFDEGTFNDEPGAFLYGVATPFPQLRYVRLDTPNRDGSTTLLTVKSFLAAGFPVAFGFPVPASLTNDPHIPYRPDLDGIRGGQAVVAVGYSETQPGRDKHVLLVRSSWGTTWGDGGYGWLPCAYVQNQLARDFWTLVNEDWLDPAEFLLPSVIDSDSIDT